MPAKQQMYDVPGLDVSTGLLLVFLAVATVTDIRRRRIFNSTTYSGILAALTVNGVGSILESADLGGGSMRRIVGWIGIGPSAVGLLACGALLVVCYLFFRIGGGDVKLMAMIGAFLGPYKGIEVVLWTFVLGAALALVILVWRVGAGRILATGLQRAWAAARLRDLSLLTNSDGEGSSASLFLAPSAAVAVLVVQFELFGRGLRVL